MGNLGSSVFFSEVVKRHADPGYTFHVSLPWTPLTPLSKYGSRVKHLWSLDLFNNSGDKTFVSLLPRATLYTRFMIVASDDYLPQK